LLGLVNDFAKERVLAAQEFTELSARAFQNIFRSPHYLQDTIVQMDRIGFSAALVVGAAPEVAPVLKIVPGYVLVPIDDDHDPSHFS